MVVSPSPPVYLRRERSQSFSCFLRHQCKKGRYAILFFSYTTRDYFTLENCYNKEYLLPKNYNNSIEHVKSIGNVFEGSLGDNFEDHFNSENGRENDIANLNYYSKLFRLVMILNTHRQCVYKDRE
jgi:hypothetical protein